MTYGLKTFIDLFCGIGGFRVALERLGLYCVYSCEKDHFARGSYQWNFGEVPPGGDIREVDVWKLRSKCMCPYDVLCAGFPCQSFSVAGRRKGFADERGNLFFEIMRFVEAHRPKVLLLENTPNIENVDGGAVLERIYHEVEMVGYSLSHAILNASHFGFPQSRKRCYFVGIRDDVMLKWDEPTPTHKPVCMSDILMPETVLDNLFIERDDWSWNWGRLNPGLGEPTDPEERNWLIHDHYIYPQNKPLWVATCNKGRQGERVYSPQGHATTQTANGGGLGAKTGMYLIDGRIRKPSVEESRRLMSFPDTHLLYGSMTEQRRQLGNAVMPGMVEVVFSGIREYGCT